MIFNNINKLLKLKAFNNLVNSNLMSAQIKRYRTGLILISTLVVSQAFAQYEMKKHTINNGGGKMTGGNYEMNSSIGQVDASTAQTGGNYSLNGGFWQKTDATPQIELIFTNGFE